jgi:hypothetical protein
LVVMAHQLVGAFWRHQRQPARWRLPRVIWPNVVGGVRGDVGCGAARIAV